MKLSLVTPCVRPENLDQIKLSINFPCDWYIVFDSDKVEKTFEENWIHTYATKGGVSGNQQRNYAVDLITDGWVYFLDDDNLVHPNFYAKIKDFVLFYADSGVGAFTFAQQLSTWVRHISTNEIRATHIDQAQYILSRDYIGDERFIQDYCADGHFIESLFKQKGSLVCLSEVLCFYNRLKW